MSDEITRRRVLRTSAATATGIGAIAGIGTASRSSLETASTGTRVAAGDERTDIRSGPADPATGDVDAERIPPIDLSDEAVQLQPVNQYGVPEQATGIRPGSQMFIELPDGSIAGCTANFIWKKKQQKKQQKQGKKKSDLYIGAAGHCFLPAGKAASRKAATPEERKKGEAFDTSKLGGVSVCADCTFGGLSGFVLTVAVHKLGEVVYARQTKPSGEAGLGHDFGLVKIPAEKHEVVNRSIPQWGGPNDVSNRALPVGTPIHQYGAGIVNGEMYLTMGSSGESLGGDDDVWFAAVRASPGDSGSPIIGAKSTDKPAAGITTHLTSFGTAGTTIGQCKEMVARDIHRDISVAQP